MNNKKNYADLGRLSTEADTLLDLHNSSHPTKAESLIAD